ncbi:myb-like protein aa [Anaeramoeba flamelloides]|uniref:Myb-like protein aa n=1 Tax=Anaeramoeba flamelloides TaxID=1746091 RepID=A0AAV7ZFE2_9EUKA|nr:myb-like protein aa [Anaeramoeba flamelloides]
MQNSHAQKFRYKMLRSFLYQTFIRSGHSPQESRERVLRIEKTAQKASLLSNQRNPVEALMDHIVSQDQRFNGTSNKAALKIKLTNSVESHLLNELRKRVIMTKPYHPALQLLGKPNPNKSRDSISEKKRKIFRDLAEIARIVVSKRAIPSKELDQYFSQWITYQTFIETAKTITHKQIKKQKQKLQLQQQQQQQQPQTQQQQFQQQQQQQQQQQNLNANNTSRIGVKTPQRNLRSSNTTAQPSKGNIGKTLKQEIGSKRNTGLSNQKGLANKGRQKNINLTNKNKGQTNTTTQKKELKSQQLTRPSLEQQKDKINEFLTTVNNVEVKNKEILREVGLFSSQLVSVNQRESHIPSSLKLNKKNNQNNKSNLLQNQEFLLKRRRISSNTSKKLSQIDSFPINNEKFF